MIVGPTIVAPANASTGIVAVAIAAPASHSAAVAILGTVGRMGNLLCRGGVAAARRAIAVAAPSGAIIIRACGRSVVFGRPLIFRIPARDPLRFDRRDPSH